MPIYEYRCLECGRRTSVFVRSMNTQVPARCDGCGGRKLRRLISRVAVLKSGEGALDGLDERMLGDVDENDPRSVARWARRMRSEMGEDLGPDFDEAIDQMEAGQFPDEDGDGGWDED
jgi:putative FmdB family regulatory protein